MLWWGLFVHPLPILVCLDDVANHKEKLDYGNFFLGGQMHDLLVGCRKEGSRIIVRNHQSMLENKSKHMRTSGISHSHSLYPDLVPVAHSKQTQRTKWILFFFCKLKRGKKETCWYYSLSLSCTQFCNNRCLSLKFKNAL